MTIELSEPSNIFTQSVATGEGLGSDIDRRIIEDGGAQGIVPIGAIIPWLKSFTNVPTLITQGLDTRFVECDGTVIADTDSPLNGETLPNLQGGEFVKGNTTSGGTGGATTHSHTIPLGSGIGSTGTTQYNPNTSTDNHLPPFHDVVWLMRIK